MNGLLTPWWRVPGALVVLFLATVLILFSLPSNDYLLLPDVAHPVAPLVHVQGGHPPRGAGIYFVDVVERKASELEALFPWLHSNASLVPAGALVPPGATAAEMQKVDLQEMSISQRVAAAVALRRLGYHVAVEPDGVIVDAIDLGTHAIGKLEPADLIVAVDGTPTLTVAKLRSAISRVHPGRVVSLRLRRDGRTLTERVETLSVQGRTIVGFAPSQSARITLPIHVSIDAGDIGGPSAGLAFTLEVMEQLGRDVTHGLRIAATGQMNLDGTVSPIGGVKQKTFGVREAHAQVFLVPAGANARTARHFAGPVRIIAVRSLAQALHDLATVASSR